MCVDRWASLPVLCCQVKWVHWSCDPFLPQLQGGWRHISLLVSADPVHLETVTGNNNLTFNNSFVAKANILGLYVRHPTFNGKSLSYCWQGHNNLLVFEACNLVVQKRKRMALYTHDNAWKFLFFWFCKKVNTSFQKLALCWWKYRVYGILLF